MNEWHFDQTAKIQLWHHFWISASSGCVILLKAVCSVRRWEVSVWTRMLFSYSNILKLLLWNICGWWTRSTAQLKTWITNLLFSISLCSRRSHTPLGVHVVSKSCKIAVKTNIHVLILSQPADLAVSANAGLPVSMKGEECLCEASTYF